jgi:hypothetical protein
MHAHVQFDTNVVCRSLHMHELISAGVRQYVCLIAMKYVCMYICVYVCMYVCKIIVRMHVCIYVYTFVCIYVGLIGMCACIIKIHVQVCNMITYACLMGL